MLEAVLSSFDSMALHGPRSYFEPVSTSSLLGKVTAVWGWADGLERQSVTLGMAPLIIFRKDADSFMWLN